MRVKDSMLFAAVAAALAASVAAPAGAQKMLANYMTLTTAAAQAAA